MNECPQGLIIDSLSQGTTQNCALRKYPFNEMFCAWDKFGDVA